LKLAAHGKVAARVAAVSPFHTSSNTTFEGIFLLLSLSLATRKPHPTQGQTISSPKTECENSL